MKNYKKLGIIKSKGRLINEPNSPYRSPFQRDRDRIIHSAAFRRLKHKTQVFVNTEGDHYRTRITHSMEVSQIARTLARFLGLNEDLSETYSVIAMVIGYDDVRPNGGPEIIIMQDESGYQIDAVVWDWDVISSAIGFMLDPYDPSEYVMHVNGTLGTYNCSWQFEIEEANNILLYDIYHPQGDLIEDQTIIKAEIVTAPYVIIPTLGERLDFHYSFPSNSRVIIRIL